MNFFKNLFEATFKNVKTDSKSKTLNYTDILKILRNAGMVAGGVFITELMSTVGNVDWGNPSLNVLFVTIAVAGLEVAQRFFKDNTNANE